MDGIPVEANKETASVSGSLLQPEKHEVDVRVDAVWQQMNKGVSSKTLNSIVNKHSATGKRAHPTNKGSNNWMSILGLGVKKKEDKEVLVENKGTATVDNGSNEEAKKLAAAAIAAARDAAAASASSRGKIESCWKLGESDSLSQLHLSRADHREFERERDARLIQQSKRRPDMREDP